MLFRVFAFVSLSCLLMPVSLAAQRGQQAPTTIRAARVLDGRGGVLDNGVIELQGSRIAKVDQRAGAVTYDLRNVTVLPGMIDVHVHLNWHFGPNGKYGEPDELAGYATDAVLDNARKTLLDRKSTRLNSSHANISYAVFCLKKK